MYNYAVIPVIALFCYSFLFITLVATKKSGPVYAFMTVLCTLIVWTGGSLLMRMNFWPSSEFWFQISLGGILAAPATLFFFVCKFIGRKDNSYIYMWAVITAAVIEINFIHHTFVKSPQYADGAYIYSFSWTVIIPFIMVALIVGQGIYLSYGTIKKKPAMRKKIRPIGIGLAALIIGHMLVPVRLFSGFPVDVCSGIVMALCMYYALYKNHLLPVKFLISKANCYAIAYALTLIICYNVIPGLALTADTRLGMSHVDTILVTTIIILILASILFGIFKSIIDNVIREEIGRRVIDIRKFGEKISNLMSVDDILKNLMDIITSTVSAAGTYILLKNQDSGQYSVAAHNRANKKEITVEQDSDVIRILEEENGIISTKDLVAEAGGVKNISADASELIKNKIKCIIAISGSDGYTGLILLTEKKNGKQYNAEDINNLTAIGSIASMAVKNSRLYETVYNEARKDYLTGAFNRKYFYEALRKCCDKGDGMYGAVLLIDIDDFKLYNQLYGNEEGDDVLKRLAFVIEQEVTEECTVARYGGKEFAVMMPMYTSGQAVKVAERVSDRVRVMNKTSGEHSMKSVTISCGVAMGTCPIEDYHELINHAEEAVYYAKQAGKNRVKTYKENQGGETDESDSRNGNQTSNFHNYASTVYALMAAIDAKDHYTFSHSENVAYYAQALAKAYGLDEEGVNLVYEAGLLHDIGKIGIEESVLNKPGKLTDEEYDIIKTHVELSIGIIRHLPSLDYVIPAVIGHHERYDGKGYPRGVKGEQIPLTARMLCVADSFDAMVSKRTYKEAMPTEDALAILRSGAGKQFDPKLVPVFINLVEKGIIEVR